jgi:hypothetical protein
MPNTGRWTGQSPVVRVHLDKYDALLRRFHELLAVLHEYDPVRGDHTTEIREGGLPCYVDDLAFLCEYKKGGDACTAIGVEDTEECFIYWVAANADPRDKIAPFLHRILNNLRDIWQLPHAQRQERQDELLSMCVQYAKLKIKELRRLLVEACSVCSNRYDDPALAAWLGQFGQAESHLDLCRLAYDVRLSEGMTRLKVIDQAPTYVRSPDERKSPSARARHYIGRLGNYVRVTKRLIDEVDLVEELVSNPFRVESLSAPECGWPPLPDDTTTLDSICNRIISHKDPMFTMLKDEFTQRDMLTKILQRQGQPKALRVHCEIQILEFFHQRKLKWAKGYKNVGCSKAACFCCQRYFRHHPAKPKEPSSHQKVWPGWGTPLLTNGSRDDGYIHQRDILNKIIEDMRMEVCTQISQGRGPHTWHEDTRTAISSLVPIDLQEDVRNQRIQLEAFSIHGLCAIPKYVIGC